jgi:hypothetical protein
MKVITTEGGSIPVQIVATDPYTEGNNVSLHGMLLLRYRRNLSHTGRNVVKA